MLVLMTILASMTAQAPTTASVETASRNPLRARIDLILNRFETAPGKVTVLAYHEFQDGDQYHSDESRDNYGFDADRRDDDRREEDRGPSSEAAPEEDPVVLS